MATQVYIGLGSNLGDPVGHVQAAIQALQHLPKSAWQSSSSLYQTQPVGGPDEQADYINAVCSLETTLSPLLLLQHLQTIEQQHQRVRLERWGPRTLDLDLLLFGQQCLHTPTLTIPHPRLHLRAFVLYPLHEIAPLLVLPGLGTLAHILQQCPEQGIERLGVST